jgi:hypothetical protein
MVDLVGRYTYLSGGGAAGSGVEPLQPTASSVTEAANFAALFDEWRCLGVTTHNRVFVDIQYPAVTPGAAYAIAFDPANAPAYASTQGVLVARRHIGPFSFNNGDGTTLSVNNTGYHKMSVKIPVPLAPTVGTNGTNAVVGNGWVSCTDTTSVVGYMKLYSDALGSTSKAYWDLFVVYHMEYRSRT